MTTEEKKAAIDEAWAYYRARSIRIPNLPWPQFLSADQALWQQYLEAERRIAKS